MPSLLKQYLLLSDETPPSIPRDRRIPRQAQRAMSNGAEPALACAIGTHNQESCRPLGKTLPLIGTLSFLTDGMIK